MRILSILRIEVVFVVTILLSHYTTVYGDPSDFVNQEDVNQDSSETITWVVSENRVNSDSSRSTSAVNLKMPKEVRVSSASRAMGSFLGGVLGGITFGWIGAKLEGGTGAFSGFRGFLIGGAIGVAVGTVLINLMMDEGADREQKNRDHVVQMKKNGMDTVVRPGSLNTIPIE